MHFLQPRAELFAGPRGWAAVGVVRAPPGAGSGGFLPPPPGLIQPAISIFPCVTTEAGGVRGRSLRPDAGWLRSALCLSSPQASKHQCETPRGFREDISFLGSATSTGCSAARQRRG